MPDQYQKNAVHGLIKKGNKYLLTRRSHLDEWKPGEWDIAGGTVEFGEINPKEALAREITEETNLVVKINNLLHLYTSMSGTSRHQFQFVYECDYLGGEIKLNPEDHEEYKWVSLKEMKKLPLIAFLDSLYTEVLLPRGF